MQQQQQQQQGEGAGLQCQGPEGKGGSFFPTSRARMGAASPQPKVWGWRQQWLDGVATVCLCCTFDSTRGLPKNLAVMLGMGKS